MKLWIRSQDKIFLGECNRIMVWKTVGCKNEEYAIINQHRYAYESDDYTTLGIYKSKERALQVLDNIDKSIRLKSYDMIYDIPEK